MPLTLVHELGHALPALAFSRERVAVRVGWRPTVSVLVLAALLIGTTLAGWPASVLVWAPAFAVAWQVLVTAIPLRYPAWLGPYAGWTSDGYRIARLLRASGE